MPATRLLVVADQKMLPALANGLRDGGKFDVLTVPLSDSASAQAAAERADALALFYGAPDKPLPAALQALSPKVRERGGRVVAVLQREQASLRDECFRAGASDLLFMPMPKDQFVARLVASVGLTWPTAGGSPAAVSVATRTATTRVDGALVTPLGVEAGGELQLKAGETVRLSWAQFNTWGLVVRGGASNQIRFAGLAPDEEALIRDWLKGGAPMTSEAPQASAPPQPADPAAAAAPAAAPAPAAAASAPAPAAPAVAPAPAAAASAPAPAAGEASRGEPAAGPPPGFADRKPIRPQSRVPARISPPVMSTAGNGAAVAAPAVASVAPAPAPVAPAPAPTPAPAAPAAAIVTPPGGSAPAPAPALSGLFEDPGAAASTGAPDAAAAPAGPSWPVPQSTAACRGAAMQFLKDKALPPETPAQVAFSTKKVVGMLGSTEREALLKAGPESHFADALAVRVALDAATGDGVKLYSATPAPVVDGAAVQGLMQASDAAASRLQKEANQAISKGEVESLQLVTAASAALSREVLSFKETADRLRGLGAAPRLGAGALDPDVILPGQQPTQRPSSQAKSAPAPVRAELRDFQKLDERRPGQGSRVALLIAAVIFVAAAINGYYFTMPSITALPTEAAGENVLRINVSGESALVNIKEAWLLKPEQESAKLVEVLRSRNVTKALVVLPDGRSAATIDVPNSKLSLVVPKTKGEKK